MIKDLTFAAVLLSLTPLSGCESSDPRRSVIEDEIGCMEEIVGVLTTVADKSSAEAARPKLEALGARMKAIEKRKSEIVAPGKTGQEVLKKLDERLEAVITKMMKESMRILMNPELNAVLKDAMPKAKLD